MLSEPEDELFWKTPKENYHDTSEDMRICWALLGSVELCRDLSGSAGLCQAL